MMFRFASPWMLLLLALIPLLIRRYLARIRKGEGGLRFASTLAVEGMRTPWTIRARHALFGLQLTGLALSVLALARPQRGTAEEEILTEGIDIVLALDASGSMAAEDFAPRNRLFVARQVARQFVQGLASDRLGLVVFAGKAVTRCPPTLDYGIVLNVLDNVQLGQIEDGTAIGNALAACLNRLRESKAKSKVIILITDGVNNRGEIQPLDAARIARTLGVKIYTVGIGSRGMARVPVDDPNYGRVYANMEVEIDEGTLSQMAETTGGLYYRATDRPSLEKIFEEIGRLEKTKMSVRSYTRYNERFGGFLGSALLLLFAAAAGFGTRLGKIP